MIMMVVVRKNFIVEVIPIMLVCPTDKIINPCSYLFKGRRLVKAELWMIGANLRKKSITLRTSMKHKSMKHEFYFLVR